MAPSSRPLLPSERPLPMMSAHMRKTACIFIFGVDLGGVTEVLSSPSDVEIRDEEPGEIEKLVFGKQTKWSAGKQLVIGGLTGCVAAFCVNQGVGNIAFALTTSLVVLQVGVYTKIITVDVTRALYCMTLANMKLQQAKDMYDSNQTPYTHHVSKFYRDNWFLCLGFGVAFTLKLMF